jgi:uncharacterized protein
MQLSVNERWILANQYRILAELLPDDRDHFAKARKALERGFALEYNAICEHVSKEADVLAEQDCEEVLDILDMFDALKSSYSRLPDKAGIEQRKTEFQGFDGNRETSQLSYLIYLWEDDRFTNLQASTTDGGNSHLPMLNPYRRMLSAWNESANKHNLTKDDVARITSVRRLTEA